MTDLACASTLLDRGVSLLLASRPAEALPLLEALVASSPDHALGLLNLGNALHSLGRTNDAVDLYTRAVAAAPDSAVALNNLARALHDLSRFDEAIARYDAALALDPGCGLALANLRQTLERVGRAGEIASRCEAVLRARPDSRDAHLYLGLALQESGRPDDAGAAFEAALALDPTFAAAQSCLGGVHNQLGRVEEAVACWARAVALAPGYHVAHSNRLLCLNYLSRPAEDLAAEHRAWGELALRDVPASDDHDNDPDPERPLRVAYLSADLRHHPVASVLEPLLAGHDPAAVEVHAYSLSPLADDDVTRRLRTHAAAWHDVAALDDDALARRLRADRVDVLVDLAGHTGGNRLPVFAHRAAPVQVTYAGYPNTTGLPTIDLRLTDATADPPPFADVLHAERLVRLPRCFLAWAPPDPSPPVTPRAPDDPARCAFGCFNNLSKISVETVAVWARLLREAPGARLLLKNHSLAAPTARARVEGLFAAHGVTADRLVLMGRLGPHEHLALHDRVAVALDPFPYNGATTTLEALWMGVPVVTLAGDRHASRVGATLLEAAGLRALVATTPDEYVALARALLRDEGALLELKRGLRDRVLASSLCDGDSLARAVEDAYREAWRAWCALTAATR